MNVIPGWVLGIDCTDRNVNVQDWFQIAVGILHRIDTNMTTEEHGHQRRENDYKTSTPHIHIHVDTSHIHSYTDTTNTSTSIQLISPLHSAPRAHMHSTLAHRHNDTSSSGGATDGCPDVMIPATDSQCWTVNGIQICFGWIVYVFEKKLYRRALKTNTANKPKAKFRWHTCLSVEYSIRSCLCLHSKHSRRWGMLYSRTYKPIKLKFH